MRSYVSRQIKCCNKPIKINNQLTNSHKNLTTTIYRKRGPVNAATKTITTTIVETAADKKD